MSEDPLKQLSALQEQYRIIHAEIGMLASAWAMLEFKINECIWILAKINPVAGGCITAQIYTLNSRIDCLLSLMKLRMIEQDLINKLNQFRTKVAATAEMRNRMIHDPIVYNQASKRAGQIEITSKGKSVFRVKELTIEEIKKLHKEIVKRLDEFRLIYLGILSVRDALPDIPKPESDPTDIPVYLSMEVESKRDQG